MFYGALQKIREEQDIKFFRLVGIFCSSYLVVMDEVEA